MASFAIDPVTRKLKIPLELVSGVDEVQQRLRIRYRFFLATWFLDLLLGLPWFQDILIKNPSLPIVGAVLRQVALTCPGVASLSAFELSLDSGTRELTVDLTAVYEDPDLGEVDRRFIITAGGQNQR